MTSKYTTKSAEAPLPPRRSMLARLLCDPRTKSDNVDVNAATAQVGALAVQEGEARMPPPSAVGAPQAPVGAAPREAVEVHTTGLRLMWKNRLDELDQKDRQTGMPTNAAWRLQDNKAVAEIIFGRSLREEQINQGTTVAQLNERDPVDYENAIVRDITITNYHNPVGQAVGMNLLNAIPSIYTQDGKAFSLIMEPNTQSRDEKVVYSRAPGKELAFLNLYGQYTVDNVDKINVGTTPSGHRLIGATHLMNHIFQENHQFLQINLDDVETDSAGSVTVSQSVFDVLAAEAKGIIAEVNPSQNMAKFEAVLAPVDTNSFANNGDEEVDPKIYTITAELRINYITPSNHLMTAAPAGQTA